VIRHLAVRLLKLSWMPEASTELRRHPSCTFIHVSPSMIISPLKAGWFMISGAILLFCAAGNTPETPNALAGLQNVLFSPRLC
jgi:hypothetical protein